MNKDTFKTFYDETIYKIAKNIEDDNQREGIRVIFKDNFDDLFREYMKQRVLLKRIMDAENSNLGKSLFHRHKVAACVTVALVNVKLFPENALREINGEYLPENSNKFNAKLAFYCGLESLFMYMNDDASMETFKHNNFIFPISTSDGKISSYVNSIICTLHCSDTLTELQTLLIANIYFLLEEYHKLAYITEQSETASEIKNCETCAGRTKWISERGVINSNNCVAHAICKYRSDTQVSVPDRFRQFTIVFKTENDEIVTNEPFDINNCDMWVQGKFTNYQWLKTLSIKQMQTALTDFNDKNFLHGGAILDWLETERD
jgi:hypothetical protein